MSTDISAELLARLESAAQTGSLGDLGIDYWDRGGPPGQGYEAEFLQEQPGGETYTRTRFDPQYSPPFRNEVYKGPISAATVQEMAALVKKALEGTYTEDLPVAIGGVTKITVRAYVVDAKPPSEVSKTFFEKLPDALSALGDLAKARMAELMKNPPTINSKRA